MAQNKVRRVKNPETFREKALKASEPKQSKKSRLTSPVKKAFSPISEGYRKFRSFESMQPIFKVLNRIGRILFPRYFRNSYIELKQVNWPTFRNGLKLTWAVIVFAVIFGLSVAALDWGLSKVFKNILLR